MRIGGSATRGLPSTTSIARWISGPPPRIAWGRRALEQHRQRSQRGRRARAPRSAILTSALQIFEDIGDRRRAAVVMNNIGIVYFIRGEYATALEFNRRALEVNRDLGNQSGVSSNLDSSGNIYRALGAYRQALQSFQQALTIRMALDFRTGVMETTHNIGLVHFSQGDYQLAIEAYKQQPSSQPRVAGAR